MPKIKSAIKRVEVAERNRDRNRHWKSAIRTMRTRVEDACKSSNSELATDSLKLAYSAIDSAVVKGILHKNTGARRKARLAKLIKKLSK